MLRRFLLGALVVSLASMAWAGVPDLTNSIAETDAPAGTSVYVLPNGTGTAFTEAFGPDGSSVDATITLTLIDTEGNPIFLYPFEDLWLEAGGNFAYCEGGTVADQSTDEMGMTMWTNPLNAGGSSAGSQTQVFVAGSALAGGLDITYNSADLNGDLLVNLSDIVPFTQMLAAYDYAGDFNNDGVINLSDIVRFTPGIGSSCN